MVADTLAQMAPSNATWVGFAYHVFDQVWGYAVTSFGGFLTGWLLVNKPRFMKKKASIKP